MALQWLTLVATIWLQSINGTNSNFPNYSSQLKRILSISQLHLNNLASGSDAGKLFGWISGLAAAYLPLHLILLIGGFLGLVGYGLQYLFLINQLPSLSYTHIFLLNILAGNSICWINTVCYIITINNFPFDRQIAVGLSTSYVGLSAKIYTDIVDVIAPISPSERAKLFLLLSSLLPLIVSVIVAPFARDVKGGKCRNLRVGFFSMYVITVITGLFSVGTVINSRFLRKDVILVGMCVGLILLLVIPLVEKIREKLEKKCLIRVHDESFTVMEKGVKEESNRDHLVEEEEEEIEAKVMVRRVEFWLYFFVYLFGATIGLVYLNNLGQIAEARGCSGTSSLVSLSSAFGFFGRLLPSLLHHFFPRSKILASSSAGAMGMMMVPMCGGFLLLVDDHNISLYISTATIGICTGAITSISISTTTQLFGTKNFGVNHNILVSNIPIGSFLFGDLAAILYKRGINSTDSGEGNCTGHKCYQTTFIIWGCLCALGILLASILHARTKKLSRL